MCTHTHIYIHVTQTCNSFSLRSTRVVSVVSVPATLDRSSSLPSSSSLVPLLPLLPDELDPGKVGVPELFFTDELLLMLLTVLPLVLAFLFLLEDCFPLDDLTYKRKLSLKVTQ